MGYGRAALGSPYAPFDDIALGDIVSLGHFNNDLALALSELGTANNYTILTNKPTTLTQTISSVPNNLSFMFTRNGTINFGAYDITSWAAKIVGDPQHQIFNYDSTGTIAFATGAVSLIRPEWWGAAGNGSTNDATALQSAINAAEASGIPLELMKKTYSFATGLTNDAPIVLKGNHGILSYTGTGTAIKINGATTPVQHFAWYDLFITKGGANANTNLRGLELDGGTVGEVSRGNFFHVKINGFNTTGSIGTYLKRNVWLCNFFGCEFFENTDAITICDGVTDAVNAVNFYGAKINGNLAKGIDINGAGKSLGVYGGEIENNGTVGVFCDAAYTNVSLHGVYFENNGTYDVHVNNAGSYNWDLRNIYVSQADGALGSIYLQAGSRAYISGSFYGESDEEDYAIATGSGFDIVQIDYPVISGYNSGTYFLNANAATKILHRDYTLTSKKYGGGFTADNSPGWWTGGIEVGQGALYFVARTAAPASPLTGGVYLADQATWDPLSIGSGGAYFVWYNGSAYRGLHEQSDGTNLP